MSIVSNEVNSAEIALLLNSKQTSPGNVLLYSFSYSAKGNELSLYPWSLAKLKKDQHIPYCLVVRIPGSHEIESPGGPGSIPGMGNIFCLSLASLFF